MTKEIFYLVHNLVFSQNTSFKMGQKRFFLLWVFDTYGERLFQNEKAVFKTDISMSFSPIFQIIYIELSSLLENKLQIFLQFFASLLFKGTIKIAKKSFFCSTQNVFVFVLRILFFFDVKRDQKVYFFSDLKKNSFAWLII